ncbi:MAG: methyltransferase domain-containing protein [Treponema sp.]|nr:methyltransferase domain-containing protein [Treponema sp.]
MSVQKKIKRAVIVQCRLSSTRLPGKALYPLDGKPVISWCLNAMKKVPADFYYVATDEASFEKLEPVCIQNGFECFKGPLEDVLERFCMVIRKTDCDTVIRATADNPFLFYEAAVQSADEFDALRGTPEQCDYFTYTGLPHGSGVEVFDGKSLLKAALLTDDPYDHEHAGPALYRHQDIFKCSFKKAPQKFFAPHLRTTIDTYGDYLKALLLITSVERKERDEPLCAETIIKTAEKNQIQKPVILVPSLKKGRGTGHLVRCLNLAKNTGSFVLISNLRLSDNNDIAFTNRIAEIITSAMSEGLEETQIIQFPPEKSFNCTYIVDTFSMTKEEAEYYSASTLVAVDDCSKFRNLCDYVLEIIPSYEKSYKSNMKNIGYLELPPHSGKDKIKDISEVKSILVCFGGEDPKGLTNPCAELCSEIFPSAKITAVCKNGIDKKNITFVSSIPNLKNQLKKYDLVFTHYGLTAFESIASGCGVILLPTSKLHKKLSEKYGFANCNLKNLSYNFVSNLVKSEKIYNEGFFKNNRPSSCNEEYKSFNDFINYLSGGKSYSCPVCGKLENEKRGKIISRNETRTYRRCPSCGLIYISYSCVSEKKYEKEYFFESYKKQYGKTYKEDFENIKKSCVKRVLEMNKILQPVKSSAVLDVGCAYGPFLKAASENGWKVFGTDICQDAVESVKKELGFKACVSAFPDIDTVKEFEIEKFDAVTMWYVIEHFQDLKTVLDKVSSLVKKGGLFAFSTPSGEGVSALTDKDLFYKISPSDHFSVWEPSLAKSVLKRFGFKVVKTVSTGHHPERFTKVKELGVSPGSEEWNRILKMSQKKHLGDTVEIYCVKM